MVLGLNRRRNLLETIKRFGKFDKTKKLKDKKDFVYCKKCDKYLRKNKLSDTYYICPSCDNHLPISGKERIDLLLDKGYELINFKSKLNNPIKFPDYENIRLINSKNGLKEAVTIAKGTVFGENLLVAALERDYLMGTLGTYVGEELSSLFEYATVEKLPVLVFSVSGGARMQEGMFSLMQMAKVTAAISKFKSQENLYISVMTNPTMGGVSASFAALGDFNIAEPGALIGFAGPRVITETLHEDLPKDFQKAEKLLELGFIDAIVRRDEQKEFIAKVIKLSRGNYGCL